MLGARGPRWTSVFGIIALSSCGKDPHPARTRDRSGSVTDAWRWIVRAAALPPPPRACAHSTSSARAAAHPIFALLHAAFIQLRAHGLRASGLADDAPLTARIGTALRRPARPKLRAARRASPPLPSPFSRAQLASSLPPGPPSLPRTAHLPAYCTPQSRSLSGRPLLLCRRLVLSPDVAPDPRFGRQARRLVPSRPGPGS